MFQPGSHMVCLSPCHTGWGVGKCLSSLDPVIAVIAGCGALTGPPACDHKPEYPLKTLLLAGHGDSRL